MPRQPISKLKAQAAEVAADLATERNDAPGGIEEFAELAYIRGFRAGVQAVIETAQYKLRELSHV